MTDSLLGLLASRTGDRWVTALALPGLLFTGIAVVAAVLGHGDWDSPGVLARRLDGNALDDLAATGGLHAQRCCACYIFQHYRAWVVRLGCGRGRQANADAIGCTTAERGAVIDTIRAHVDVVAART